MCLFYRISASDPRPLRIRSISVIRYNPHLNSHPAIIPPIQICKKYGNRYANSNIRSDQFTPLLTVVVHTGQ
jgi:hypothetical protein